MSKVTDSWNAYLAAKDRLGAALDARGVAERTRTATCVAAEAHAGQLATSEKDYLGAKAQMIRAADALRLSLERAAAGQDNDAYDAWREYASARDAVARHQLAVRQVIGEGAALLQRREAEGKLVIEAQAAVERAEKYVREAAEACGRLIPSEVAGYCGKLAPRADGEEVLLTSAPVQA